MNWNSKCLELLQPINKGHPVDPYGTRENGPNKREDLLIEVQSVKLLQPINKGGPRENGAKKREDF